MTATREALTKKIMVLNDRIWERRVPQPRIDRWLSNFTGRITDVETEQLHALFWLSQFMYFGSREIRVLLKSLYRDLYFCPMIQEVRAQLPSDASDEDLAFAINDELAHTRFFGVGNPSESGIHLLYYFRQENSLAKEQFMDAIQIFKRGPARNGSDHRILRKSSIRRYVFLDDICGSGETALIYSDSVLGDIHRLDSSAIVSYYSLFGTKTGLNRVRQESLFGERSAAVYELDDTYRCLSASSRYFTTTTYSDIDPTLACSIAREYGELLDPDFAAGYKDSQMLLGFHHNTPDNTLGIIWQDHLVHSTGLQWSPIFKRYPKIYGGDL
jgi:hypothetical protein